MVFCLFVYLFRLYIWRPFCEFIAVFCFLVLLFRVWFFLRWLAIPGYMLIFISEVLCPIKYQISFLAQRRFENKGICVGLLIFWYLKSLQKEALYRIWLLACFTCSSAAYECSSFLLANTSHSVHCLIPPNYCPPWRYTHNCHVQGAQDGISVYWEVFEDVSLPSMQAQLITL